MQLPLLPDVTSKKSDGFDQTKLGSAGTPSSVNEAATMGDDALVPPTTIHCPPQLTATPVCGSPTAETSASMRKPQLVVAWGCQAGRGMKPLQPLPPLLHAVSLQPREPPPWLRVVPPTAITPAEVAGYDAP